MRKAKVDNQSVAKALAIVCGGKLTTLSANQYLAKLQKSGKVEGDLSPQAVWQWWETQYQAARTAGASKKNSQGNATRETATHFGVTQRWVQQCRSEFDTAFDTLQAAWKASGWQKLLAEAKQIDEVVLRAKEIVQREQGFSIDTKILSAPPSPTSRSMAVLAKLLLLERDARVAAEKRAALFEAELKKLRTRDTANKEIPGYRTERGTTKQKPSARN